jgi:hypothetical protein
MKPMSSGNGSGKHDIHIKDHGGWVQVFPSAKQVVPDDSYLKLSHALSHWLRQRPHLRLRCAVPIDRDGITVELHAWYDTAMFPPLAPTPNSPT